MSDEGQERDPEVCDPEGTEVPTKKARSQKQWEFVGIPRRINGRIWKEGDKSPECLHPAFFKECK